MKLSGVISRGLKVFLIIGFMILVLDIESRTLSTCIVGEQAKTNGNNQYSDAKHCATIFGVLLANLGRDWCIFRNTIGDNISNISAASSAVATCVIAIFTITLLITQHSVDLLVATGLPKAHGYPSTINMDATLVLERGDTHIMTSSLYPTFLNAEAIRDLQQSKTTLWAYGHVFYWNFLEKSKWFIFRAHLEFPPRRGPEQEPYFVIDCHRTSDVRDEGDT